MIVRLDASSSSARGSICDALPVVRCRDSNVDSPLAHHHMGCLTTVERAESSPLRWLVERRVSGAAFCSARGSNGSVRAGREPLGWQLAEVDLCRSDVESGRSVTRSAGGWTRPIKGHWLAPRLGQSDIGFAP